MHTVHNSPKFNIVQENRLKSRSSTVHTFSQLDFAILKTRISFDKDVQNHKTTYNVAVKNHLPSNGISSVARFAYKTSDGRQKFIPTTLSKFGIFFL